LRLSVIEDVIRVSVDGTEIIAVRDGSPLPPGLIGFSGYNLDASGLRIDDFSLWLPSEDIAETPAVTPTPTPTPTLETLPPEPELMLMVEDNFDTADLSQWSAGAAWTFISSALVPMLTQDTEEEIVSLPEATAELSMEEETPTVEAAPPESTDVFVEEGQSLQGISGDSPLSLNYRPLRNLVVQADVSVGSGTVQFSIRQSELGAYQLTIHPDGSVELFRNDVLVRAGTMPPQGSLWQSVRLAAIENGLRVSIDNVDVITFVDSNPLPEGNIAFSVLQLPAADLENPDAVYLDNFKLWIPTNEIPAPALTDEPPLQILFSDNFDSGSLAAWTLDTYWISDYSASSLAVENRTSGQGAYLLENELYDAAAEITFYVSGGMADVRLRETEAGAYIARFNPAGEVSLYRGEVLLQSVPVVPSQPWEWRRLRLSAFGNTIRVAVDGVQVIEQLDETPLESGLVSFAGYFPSRDSQSVIRVDTFEVWIASETASSTTPLNPEFPDALEAARQPLEAMSFGLTSFQSTTPPIPLIGWVAYTDWEGGVDREEIRIADVTDNNGETDVGIKVIGRPGSMEVEPAISPDGTRIAFASDCLDNFEIYVLDLTGWNATVDPCAGSPLITPLTDTPASVSNTQPVWSPDGTRIAFISNRPDTETQENIGWKIYIVDALSGENALSGEDAPRLTPNVPSLSEFEPAWSPDGREIAYRLSGCGSDYDIYRATAYELLSHGSCVALQDPENGLQLIAGPGDDRQPAWSPDGRLLAYSAFRSSNTPNIYEDIYVVSTNGAAVNGGPAGGEINLTSPLAGNSLAGGSNTDPSWSPDMKTIAFVSNFVSGGYATRIHVVDIIDVIYGSSPSTVQLTFNPVLNARSAHGFWVRFGSPDWSQYLTCNDGKDAADERTDSLTNTLVTPLFYQRLACLTRYSGVAFMAIYHETNENRSIDFNEISSLVAGSNLADPYISAFDNANSAYDHRYMFSVSVVNGLVRTARTTDPAAFLSNNYFCTAVLRECEDDTLGSDNDRDGDGNYVEAGETDTAGNPLDPTASAPGNIFDVFDGNPGWLAGSFAPQCVEEDEITVPNTLCLDANWYYRLMITWGRATVSATDLSPLYPRWNEAYREILPYMRMAMFDEVLAEVNQLDIVRGGSEVKDANRLGTDLLGEPITITVLTRWFVSEGHTITSQYMTHLDELFFVQAECVVPIALRDGVPPMVSDGDPPRVSPRVTNLRGGTQYPLRNAIRIGLSNDSLYIHLLVPEYNNNGAITALTWKTTVFQFGISVEDGLVNGIAPVNLQSSGFEFLISQVRPQPVTCP
jgi:Tol biopolymer transport system component